jgi:hypothetical protein
MIPTRIVLPTRGSQSTLFGNGESARVALRMGSSGDNNPSRRRQPPPPPFPSPLTEGATGMPAWLPRTAAARHSPRCHELLRAGRRCDFLGRNDGSHWREATDPTPSQPDLALPDANRHAQVLFRVQTR